MAAVDIVPVSGDGDRTFGPVLRCGSPRLVVQEFWAWLTAPQQVRASAVAALDIGAAAAHALRRREGSGPVTTNHVSFTTARHHAIRSMTWSQVTAATSLPGMAAVADAAASAALHTLITTGRQRRSPRARNVRPRFPHTASTKKTVTGIPQITRFAPARHGPGPAGTPVRKEEPPRSPWPWPVEPRTRSVTWALSCTSTGHQAAEPDHKPRTAPRSHNSPDGSIHLKSLVLRTTQ